MTEPARGKPLRAAPSRRHHEEANDDKDVDLSTAGRFAAGLRTWLNIESARWLKIQSAPTDGGAESGVRYLKIENAAYEMRRFEDGDLMEAFKANTIEVGKPEKTLFSHIVIDSNSGPERGFAQACEDNDDVLFYVKLPRWFEIDTPVGRYNPDWAVAYRNDQVLYFVAETKKTGASAPVQRGLLRPLEDYRIECGYRHFRNFEGVKFKVVSSLPELLS